MFAARVEQKNGTYLNNIQRDRQSSPSLNPSPYLVPILAAIHTADGVGRNLLPALPQLGQPRQSTVPFGKIENDAL
jgi:hypothetical protein